MFFLTYFSTSLAWLALVVAKLRKYLAQMAHVYFTICVRFVNRRARRVTFLRLHPPSRKKLSYSSRLFHRSRLLDGRLAELQTVALKPTF